MIIWMKWVPLDAIWVLSKFCRIKCCRVWHLSKFPGTLKAALFLGFQIIWLMSEQYFRSSIIIIIILPVAFFKIHVFTLDWWRHWCLNVELTHCKVFPLHYWYIILWLYIRINYRIILGYTSTRVTMLNDDTVCITMFLSITQNRWGVLVLIFVYSCETNHLRVVLWPGDILWLF